MFDWKSHLHAILIGLCRTHPTAPLAEVERIVSGILDLEGITFLGRAGRRIPGDTPLRDAWEDLRECNVRLQVAHVPARAGPAETTAATASTAPTSRFREGPSVLESQDITADPRFDEFLREFARLEEHHQFMWAGYVVRELLPRLGFPAEEAKLVLDRLRSENLVTVSKVPNPKNPDFPATGVHLNREHPRMKVLLERIAAERQPPPEQPTTDKPVATEQT